MNAQPVYKFVDSSDRGVIVVATKDFLTGDLVMEEKEPILHFSNQFLEKFVTTALIPKENFHCFAAYSVFRDLPSEKKQQFLSLFGPTDTIHSENMRKFASSGGFLYKNRVLYPEEVEAFVKVGSVARLNMFGDKNGHYIYENITRLAHSCQSNCHYNLRDGGCSIRANRPIRTGEELTISYVGERDILPTHDRRFLYLKFKEFTCHCSRCDAPGDDTRRFDCFDPNCKGVMMVCQPIDKRKIPITDLPYTGVEYVEPHLLPCTVCHRAAPADYQAKMFELESQLPSLTERFATVQRNLVGRDDAQKYQPLLAEMTRLKLPRRHLMCQSALNTEMKIHRYSFLRAALYDDKVGVVHFASEVRRVAADYIDAIESVLSVPHQSVHSILYAVVSDCILEWRQYQEIKRKEDPSLMLPSIYPPVEAKALLQKTLRMLLVLNGRDMRQSELDTAVLQALEDIARTGATVAVHPEVCAFCEESPLRAALTLSRCGRCRQVVYCSVGCQKAHWKVHKKNCKAAIADEMGK